MWKESTILEIGDPSSLGFCTSVNEGVILISSNKELLKTALEQLEKGATLKNDKSFYAVHQTAGEKATARIYFNYSKMALGLKRYATKNLTIELQILLDLQSGLKWIYHFVLMQF